VLRSVRRREAKFAVGELRAQRGEFVEMLGVARLQRRLARRGLLRLRSVRDALSSASLGRHCSIERFRSPIGPRSMARMRARSASFSSCSGPSAATIAAGSLATTAPFATSASGRPKTGPHSRRSSSIASAGVALAVTCDSSTQRKSTPETSRLPVRSRIRIAPLWRPVSGSGISSRVWISPSTRVPSSSVSSVIGFTKNALHRSTPP
jgi:hypothetical protein